MALYASGCAKPTDRLLDVLVLVAEPDPQEIELMLCFYASLLLKQIVKVNECSEHGAFFLVSSNMNVLHATSLLVRSNGSDQGREGG